MDMARRSGEGKKQRNRRIDEGGGREATIGAENHNI